MEDFTLRVFFDYRGNEVLPPSAVFLTTEEGRLRETAFSPLTSPPLRLIFFFRRKSVGV
jgi:hypothetical protein